MVKATIKERNPKEKKINENRFKEMLGVANEIMHDKREGMVIIFKFDKTTGGVKADGMCKVHNVPRHAQLNVIMEGMQIDPIEILASTLTNNRKE